MRTDFTDVNKTRALRAFALHQPFLLSGNFEVRASFVRMSVRQIASTIASNLATQMIAGKCSAKPVTCYIFHNVVKGFRRRQDRCTIWQCQSLMCFYEPVSQQLVHFHLIRPKFAGKTFSLAVFGLHPPSHEACNKLCARDNDH